MSNDPNLVSSKTSKSKVILRAIEVSKQDPTLKGVEIALALAPEFPELAFRTLHEYCKPSKRAKFQAKRQAAAAAKADADADVTDTKSGEEDFSVHSQKYLHLPEDGVYLVFSPYRDLPLRVPESTHKEILRMYSWDGDGATIRECSEKYGLELAEMRWYLKAFNVEHGKLPFTDEEVAETIGDEAKTHVLVERGLAIQRGKVSKKIAKARQKALEEDAAFGRDFKKQTAFIASTIADALSRVKVKKVKKVKKEAPNKDTLAVLPLYDIHVGKQLFNGGTKPFPRDAVSHLIDVSTSDSVIVVFGGDYFHVDTAGGTTTRGTVQDVHGTIPQTVYNAYQEAMWVLIQCMSRFTDVHVAVVAGNHDHMSCLHLREFLRHTLPLMTTTSNDGSISLLDSDNEHLVVTTFGQSLLAFEHGDGPAPKDLMTMLHTNYRMKWGSTTRTYAHIGHRHHAYEQDVNGGIVTQQPSPAGTDPWHRKKGFSASEKALRLYEYHAKHGLRAMFHYTV